MIFHLGTHQNFRLASLSAAALALGLCATIASIEPTRPADEQRLDESVSPPTLSPSGKIVDRLDAAGDLPEEVYPLHSEARFVSGFEFFPPTQDVSLGLQAAADAEARLPQPQVRSVALASQPKSTSGQGKLALAVIPPARPKDLDAIGPSDVATAEARVEPVDVLGLKLPRVVSTAQTAVMRQVVAWGGTISQIAQGL